MTSLVNQQGASAPTNQKGKNMKRLMKKEPTPLDLVAEAMSDELHFEVTKEQAIQRLCNEYLNNVKTKGK